MSKEDWFFAMYSDGWKGRDQYGPYDSEEEAQAGRQRIESSLSDNGLKYWFSGPYLGTTDE